jgi:hypothetical protein
MLNIFADDFPANQVNAAGQFLSWVAQLLPRHLRIRLMMQRSSFLSLGEFTPLETIYREAGLKPGPV